MLRNFQVAEKLVTEARKRGLCVNIFRLGMVSWDTERGHYNQRDWFNRLITGIIELGRKFYEISILMCII